MSNMCYVTGWLNGPTMICDLVRVVAVSQVATKRVKFYVATCNLYNTAYTIIEPVIEKNVLQ